MTVGRTPTPLFASLRSRMMLATVALAILPLLAAVFIVGQRANSNLRSQSLDLQQEIVASVSHRIDALIRDRGIELERLESVHAIDLLSRSEQRSLLENLLANEVMYQELAIVDAAGIEQVRITRGVVTTPGDSRDRSADPALVEAMAKLEAHYGPVGFDPAQREPIQTIAFPWHDRRTLERTGALMATLRYRPVWDLIHRLDLPAQTEVYVVDSNGIVVAHRDPGVVLSRATIDGLQRDGVGLGLIGDEVMTASAPVPLGDQQLTVIAEQPLSIALAVPGNATRVALAVALGGLLLAVLLVIIGVRSFVRPVEDMATTAELIADGDLSKRVQVKSKTEIGDLADSFNAMTERLSDVIAGLERRVHKRTRALKAATGRQRSLIDELEARNDDLRATRDQLQELMKSKDQFLSSISHELRTPLTSIVGFSAELTDRYDGFDEAERKELVDFIADQSQEMSYLINDLLVAARSDLDTLVIQKARLDIREEVQSVVEAMDESRLSVRLPDQPAVAYADPVRVRQVLRNLVGNSIRYGGEHIEVVVGASNGTVDIEIRDDGAGIPESERTSIFDAYYSAHSVDGQPESVGLGLTVSRMLARRMDGDITYAYVDGESIFELVLPAAMEPEPAPR